MIGILRRPSALLAGLALCWSSMTALVAGEAAEPSLGQVTPRIVGGTEVSSPADYPFMVALVRAAYEDEHQGLLCGGSLIEPEWVLTAAHCLGAGTAGIDVVVGRIDLTDEGSGERIGVVEVHQHPDYDYRTLANDVGLIRLERSAAVGAGVPLATAADAASYAPGVMATVAGWGNTLGLPPGTPEHPAILRAVDVPIVSDGDCAAVYPEDFIPPGMVCAGYLDEDGMDACSGDSGGPLLADGRQVGIVSGGFGCAVAGQPGLYARVAVYTNWIEAVLSETPPASSYACRGIPATIIGTAGDDRLEGTSGDDVIVALEGDDQVWGSAGHDRICLGAGRDRAYGGPGDDSIYGQGGADQLDGNLGDDLLAGGTGGDVLIGGEGADRLRGNRGDDTLHGLLGDDLLRGGPGDDTLAGGDGDDRLFGGLGADVLRGGPGTNLCRTGESVVC